MKITKVTDSWYKAEYKEQVFFGFTREQVVRRMFLHRSQK